MRAKRILACLGCSYDFVKEPTGCLTLPSVGESSRERAEFSHAGELPGPVLALWCDSD